jgi:hypothetical protein
MMPKNMICIRTQKIRDHPIKAGRRKKHENEDKHFNFACNSFAFGRLRAGKPSKRSSKQYRYISGGREYSNATTQRNTTAIGTGRNKKQSDYRKCHANGGTKSERDTGPDIGANASTNSGTYPKPHGKTC